MVGTLILTHGGLARELLAAAQIIAGPPAAIEALSLDWHDSFDGAREKVAAALGRLDQGDGVLVLTDMYGGTPSNVAMTFFTPGRVEVLAGVNLPMVLRLNCRPRGGDLAAVAHWLQEKGNQSHCLASDRRPCAPQATCDALAAEPIK